MSHLGTELARAIQLPHVTRRATLGGMSAALALGGTSAALATTPSSARLVVLNIRGALDGLAAVIPYGDPALAGLRAGLVPPNMIKVDNFFALHPAFTNFYAMMQAGEAMAIHAVGPTVAQRSHFAGQDYLQGGSGQLMSSGWLNRAIGAMGGASGLVCSPQMPLLMRGPATTNGYVPEPFPQTPTALASKLPALMAADALIGPAETVALADRATYNQILGTTSNLCTSSLPLIAQTAAKLMAASNGPRVLALQTGSVDTHSDQNGRITPLLMNIDLTIAALKAGLGAAWANTVVMTMTEFGRTAYENGTQGTDHGTAFAVLLAGGAVAGGKVMATWPGMASNQLFQGRDLAPTVDFRSIAMGILSSHMGLSSASQQVIFPGSVGVTPLSGLMRS